MELKKYRIGDTFQMEEYINGLNEEFKKRKKINENNELELTEVAEEVEWLELD